MSDQDPRSNPQRSVASTSSSTKGVSGPADAGPSQSGSRPSASSKAIGSLAKKPADVTRQGTQKLKFVPTIPSRRKKDAEVKQEPISATVSNLSDQGRGRGRGRGRGDGRGTAPARQPMEMTASGPFAMGPLLAGQSSRRGAPRSNFTPVGPSRSGGGSSSLGATLSGTRAPSLKKEQGKDDNISTKINDEDEYSDPDEGVEIVDMEQVRQMDWMAPESLHREKNDGKRKKAIRLKKELPTQEQETEEVMDIDEAAAAGEVDLANALDLSESEEEEELEDLIEDFALQADQEQDLDIRQERLYFFQFPNPFPTFASKAHPQEVPMDVDTGQVLPTTPKKVSFAPDSKPPQSESSTTSALTSAISESQTKPAEEADPKVDGIIGQLEIHQSGAVKLRLGNGIVMDVTAATQPSFLQHAAYIDMPNKRLSVLGEVNKRFVVSPNVETLLSAMDSDDRIVSPIDI